jgi:anthranilate synthase component 1
MSESAPTVSARPSKDDERQLVPVQRELLADMLTPVSAYARLCPPGQLGFLLESVEGGERLARYSYIGYRPEPLDVGDGDPLPALARVAAQQPVAGPGLPRFLGGAVGFIGYEAARHFERLPAAS